MKHELNLIYLTFFCFFYDNKVLNKVINSSNKTLEYRFKSGFKNIYYWSKILFITETFFEMLKIS